MSGITMDILVRRERELAGAITEIQGLIGYLQKQQADEEQAKAEAEKTETAKNEGAK